MDYRQFCSTSPRHFGKMSPLRSADESSAALLILAWWGRVMTVKSKERCFTEDAGGYFDLGVNARDRQKRRKPYIASNGHFMSSSGADRFVENSSQNKLIWQRNHSSIAKITTSNTCLMTALGRYCLERLREKVRTWRWLNSRPPFAFMMSSSNHAATRCAYPEQVLNCRESIVVKGCILEKCQVKHSVLGVSADWKLVGAIEDSFDHGADFYQLLPVRQSEGETTSNVWQGITV